MVQIPLRRKGEITHAWAIVLGNVEEAIKSPQISYPQVGELNAKRASAANDTEARRQDVVWAERHAVRKIEFLKETEGLGEGLRQSVRETEQFDVQTQPRQNEQIEV